MVPIVSEYRTAANPYISARFVVTFGDPANFVADVTAELRKSLGTVTLVKREERHDFTFYSVHREGSDDFGRLYVRTAVNTAWLLKDVARFCKRHVDLIDYFATYVSYRLWWQANFRTLRGDDRADNVRKAEFLDNATQMRVFNHRKWLTDADYVPPPHDMVLLAENHLDLRDIEQSVGLYINTVGGPLISLFTRWINSGKFIKNGKPVHIYDGNKSVVARFFRPGTVSPWTYEEWRKKGFLGWNYSVQKAVWIVCFEAEMRARFKPALMETLRGLKKFGVYQGYREATYTSFV
jgi:hypothetical protein